MRVAVLPPLNIYHMKKTDRKFFIAFLCLVSFLSPACNHPRPDARVIYMQYIHAHLKTHMR